MFEGAVIPYYSNFWFSIAVGNALKFTHEGSVSVHVRVASDNLKASLMKAGHSFTAPDGKNSKLTHLKLQSILYNLFDLEPNNEN